MVLYLINNAVFLASKGIIITFVQEMIERRERGRSLLLLYNMDYSSQIQAVSKKTEELIAGEPDLFLVEVKIKPTNNVKVFIDGDQGVTIERLIQYNRSLYKHLEESGLFPNGDFSLEVSSPGLDEPLKMHRQYLKNTGRSVEVVTADGLKKEGKLVSANEEEIVVEEIKGKGKKAEVVNHTIPFNQIKSTKIQIKF